MSNKIKQQIVISGVGGQGVLFVTRLLAEAAINLGYPVFTSETHGMAQRGGTVISHLKVGEFSSPLIQPHTADGLIVLKSENIAQHGAYLKADGWVVVNGQKPAESSENTRSHQFYQDADALALEFGNPKSVNLILLGYAISENTRSNGEHVHLFCEHDDIVNVLETRFAERKKLLKNAMDALETGYHAS